MSTLTHGTDASKMESKEFQIDVYRALGGIAALGPRFYEGAGKIGPTGLF